MVHNILIGDANRSLLAFHESLLQQAGYRVATAHDMSAISAQLRLSTVSLVIAELALPEAGQDDAVNLVRRVAALRPGTPVLVLTSSTDPTLHRQARALGIWDISIKPTPCAELLSLTRNILDSAYPECSGGTGSFTAGRSNGSVAGAVIARSFSGARNFC